MPLPEVDTSRIKHFHAQWLGLASLMDGPDPDDKPDLDSLDGAITISMYPQGVLAFGGENPFTIVPTRRVIRLNSGASSVMLESTDSDTPNKKWRWQAKFNVAYRGVPVSIPDAIFMARDGDRIDLTSFIGRSGTDSFFFENPIGSGLYDFYQGTLSSDEYGFIPSSPYFIEDPPGSGLYRMEPT